MSFNRFIRPVLLCGLVSASGSLRAAVFSEDFTGETLNSNPNGYLGGWYGSNVNFDQWNGPGEATIAGGQLTVATTSSIRSAGIFLSPAIFSGAGTYTLSFDVTSYSGDANDSGLVRVWSASGYVFGASPNAVILDTLNAQLTPQGSATVANVTPSGGFTFTSAGAGNQFNFVYDGTSAVALFFGVSTSGFPFPTATFDNISISPTFVPEAPAISAAAFLVLMASGSYLIRRRNSLRSAPVS